MKLSLFNKEYDKCESDTSRVYMIEKYIYKSGLYAQQKKVLESISSNDKVYIANSRQMGTSKLILEYLCCELILSDSTNPLSIYIGSQSLKSTDFLRNYLCEILEIVPIKLWAQKKRPQKGIYVISNKKCIELYNGSKIYFGPIASEKIVGMNFTHVFIDCASFVNEEKLNGFLLYTMLTPKIIMNGDRNINPITLFIHKFKIEIMHWFYNPKYRKGLCLKCNADTFNIPENTDDNVIDQYLNLSCDISSDWYKEMEKCFVGKKLIDNEIF